MIENEKIELNPKMLKALLTTAGKNDPRKHLNSIAIKDGFLVSTDGSRAARWKFQTESESFKKLEIIIPRFAIDSIIPLAGKAEGRLFLKHNQENTQCLFEYVKEEGLFYLKLPSRLLLLCRLKWPV